MVPAACNYAKSEMQRGNPVSKDIHHTLFWRYEKLVIIIMIHMQKRFDATDLLTY
jgi:hypothetical protein